MVAKAVIPAAGFGTRLLPASKAVPKELLPVVDKPVLQYVVEEAVASGITDILLVISRSKRAIEEHFDRNAELERDLESKGKLEALESIRLPTRLARIQYVWQQEMRGLGDAVRMARTFVGGDPFAILMGDTLLESTCDRPVLRQILDAREARGGGSVVALEEVPLEKVSRYGVIDGSLDPDGLVTIRGLVEKPSPEEAPSRRVIASRYVLEPEIFDCLDRTPPGKGGEIQLTDAMRMLLATRPMTGCPIRGIRHDAGNRLDFLKTNIHYALQRPDLREPLLAYLRDIVKG